MTKRQKVSFIVTTGDDEVLDNMAVELNCQGFGQLEHIEIDANPMIPLTQDEVTKFNNFAEEKENGKT